MKLPFTNNIESFIRKYGVIFTVVVMYQGLFGGLAISNEPSVLRKLNQNVLFKLFTLFAVGFTATRDVETTLIGMVLFIILLHLLRTPEERKKITFKNIL